MSKAPPGLSRSESRQYRALKAQLIAVGINPGERLPLILDYLRQDVRVAALRAAEETTSNMATTRALNVATAERRRLHQAIFRGARRRKARKAIDAPTISEAQGDMAWRGAIWGPVLCPDERDMIERALLAKYGEPRWQALLYRDAAEEEREEALLRDGSE